MIANQFDAFLLDLDGVVYLEDQPIPGTVETIAQLRDRDISIRFITNSASRSRDDIVEKLAGMGIKTTESEIISAAWATAKYLETNGYSQVHVIGQDGLYTELSRRGIAICDDDPDAVVVGSDYSVTYEKLRTATQLIHDRGLPFVATNIDPSYPTPDGIAPGTGAIVKAVETATGIEPAVVGKPRPTMFEFALEDVDTNRVAMVGDTLITDIKGAQSAGIPGILVSDHQRTYEKHRRNITPDIALSNLSELLNPDIELPVE